MPKSILIDQMKCGGCGADTFTVANHRAPDEHRATVGAVAGDIVLTCTGCKSDSVITVRPAALAIAWGEPEGLGIICGGWRNST